MEKYLINDEFVNVKSRVEEYLEKNNIHQFLSINQGEYAKKCWFRIRGYSICSIW